MTEFNFRFWAPLINFKSDTDILLLHNNLKIRHFSEHERDLLPKFEKIWTNVKYGDFLLEVNLKKESPESEIGLFFKDGWELLERAVTILRLYRQELIGFNLIVQPLSEEDFYGYHVRPIPHYNLWGGIMSESESFSVNGDEVNALENFYNEYFHLSFDELSLAIDYFNKSYIEPYPFRDSFLDLMIALENLFLKGSNQELGYKLRMRVAYLLGKDFKERKEIYDFMGQAYGLRSKIVHGDETKGLTNEFLFQTREITRRSLKILLKDPPVRKTFDELILRGASLGDVSGFQTIL